MGALRVRDLLGWCFVPLLTLALIVSFFAVGYFVSYSRAAHRAAPQRPKHTIPNR